MRHFALIRRSREVFAANSRVPGRPKLKIGTPARIGFSAYLSLVKMGTVVGFGSKMTDAGPDDLVQLGKI